jgi:hypothetical protein
MAKKTEAAADAAPVDPAGIYEVRMARSVKHGNTWLRPNAHRIRVSGAALIALGDAVAEARRVDA